MAEIGLIPHIPAAVAALDDATGWFDSFPLTPGQMVADPRDATAC